MKTSMKRMMMMRNSWVKVELTFVRARTVEYVSLWFRESYSAPGVYDLQIIRTSRSSAPEITA